MTWLELEKFLFYGVLTCADTFLSLFTYFPIRVVVAIFSIPSSIMKGKFSQNAVCDLLRFSLIVGCCFFLRWFIDVNVFYHWIRGDIQSIIKLYVLFNLFDVFDKLFSSFGQDVLDSLYWQATKGTWTQLLLHFSTAITYIICHSLVYVFQVSWRAFNSDEYLYDDCDLFEVHNFVGGNKFK
eukprot:m.91757 g.91757  ORF g.91757 m.91757 type:complete len:182 (+) comp13318_c0_seq5:85-630(+)